MDISKAANMADWLEAQMHQQFTVLADNLFAEGRITRDERIALSNGVGGALDAFHERLQQDDLKQLAERRPYEEAPAQPPSLVVKSLGTDRIGGYAVLWGDKERKDLTGEYFAPDTADLTAIFDEMGALPSLYHHAMDSQLKTAIVGRVDVLKADAIGLWYEAQLAQSNKYKNAIMQLVEKGALGTSTGTLPGARKGGSDGKILRWPVAEISLTPTPAEPRMMERPVAEIKAAYAAIGLELPIGDAEGAAKARGVATAIEAEALAWEALELESV